MNAILRQRKGDFGTVAATKELVDKLTGAPLGVAAAALLKAELADGSRNGRTAGDAVSDHASKSVESALDALTRKEKAKLLHHLQDFDNVYAGINPETHDWLGAGEVREAVINGLEAFMRKHGRSDLKAFMRQHGRGGEH